MILLFITAPPYRTRGRLLCSFQARLDDVVSMNGDSKVNRLEQSSSQHAGKMCKRNVDIDRKKLFKKTQVSPIKSSSYEPYPVVSKQKAAPCVRRQMKEWLELTDVFANDFRVVMRSRDYESAMALYKRMADADYIPNENLLNGLLAICQKKSHMINALELFNDFTMMGITPNETAYMALIRCHTDNGEFNTALKLIDEMKLLSLQLKLRTYHPILEAACKELDFQSGILIINQMLLDDVIPHSEQVVILLEAAALSGALKDERNRQKIDTLLLDDKLHLLDMDLLGLQRILSASRGMTMTEIRDEGVLQGVFIPDTMPYQCQTLQEAIDFIGSDHVLNPVIGISCDTESIHSNETKKRRMYDILPSRMVNIVKGTCSCPNCGGDLNPLLLDPVGRERVRLGLISIALGASSYQALCIQTFGKWLKAQEEFKYVVDGANVAYHHQNFEGGKFSFRQIELIVDSILARKDGKVLVLLPSVYAKKNIPNSSNGLKTRDRRDLISSDDERILKRLEDENMLYIVPQGADDDWYWIYATVTEDRQSTAFVVTNDMIRDHRLAFLEPRPFTRWRSTQMMGFSFSRAVKDDLSSPEIFLFEAEMYTSELQKTLAGRWHIPCARDGLWLCLSDTPTVGQELGTEDTADFNGSSDLITSGKNDNSCNSPSSNRRERTGGEEGGDRVNSRDSSSKAAYPLGLDLAVDTFHSSYSKPQGHLKLNTSFDEASVSIITDAIDKDWSTPRKTETILSISASAVRDLEELRVDSKSKIQRVEKKKNPNQETHLNSSYYDENGS